MFSDGAKDQCLASGSAVINVDVFWQEGLEEGGDPFWPYQRICLVLVRSFVFQLSTSEASLPALQLSSQLMEPRLSSVWPRLSEIFRSCLPRIESIINYVHICEFYRDKLDIIGFGQNIIIIPPLWPCDLLAEMVDTKLSVLQTNVWIQELNWPSDQKSVSSVIWRTSMLRLIDSKVNHQLLPWLHRTTSAPFSTLCIKCKTNVKLWMSPTSSCRQLQEVDGIRQSGC